MPEVAAGATFSSNSGYASAGIDASDVVLTLRPRVSVFGRGARTSVEGALGADAIVYVRHTQRSLVRPRGDLQIRSVLIDQWLDVDASLDADRVAANPYQAQPQGASSYNDYTAVRLRAAPTLRHSFGPSFSLLGRSEQVLTRRVGSAATSSSILPGQSRDSHVSDDLLRLTQSPLPWGWVVEWHARETGYTGTQVPVLRSDAVRLSIVRSFPADLELSLIGGRERTWYGIQRTDSVLGTMARWTPTERTEFSATVERRFYGTGVDLKISHRTPWMAFKFKLDRQSVAQADSNLLGASGTDIAKLLDGMLTTRITDATTRQQAVQKLIADYQLPGTLSKPAELFSSYAQLQTQATATAVFQGRRTTAEATLYARQQVRLSGVDELLPPAAINADNQQRGFEVNVSHRLTPSLTGLAGFRRAQIVGLAATQNQHSHDSSLTVGLSQTLSPASRLTVGARHQSLNSNVANSAKESAFVSTLTHRF